MADPISTASGILTLAVFAFQSSQVLYQAVASFQSHHRNVRQLKEEVEALSGALGALQETATNTDFDFSMLRLPLLRCGKACKEFEAVIIKCTAHSGESRTSFRDWAKLRYMGEDIAGFKDLLAGYKSTIMIAMGAANIRTSVVTVKVLAEYKDLITNTTVDLEEQLQTIDGKLQALSQPGVMVSDEVAAERRQIQEERDSTQQCLSICAQVDAHMDQLRPTAFESTSTPPGASQAPGATLHGQHSARFVTDNAFKACKERFSDTTTELQRHLQDVDARLQNLYAPSGQGSVEHGAEQERIKEELESIKQCLAICANASTSANNERTNVFEDVSMADDGHQVLVSTIGDLILARRITGGDRARQWLGQMSDDSLQHLSRTYGPATTEDLTESQAETSGHFEGRYGMGVKLSVPYQKDAGAK